MGTNGKPIVANPTFKIKTKFKPLGNNPKYKKIETKAKPIIAISKAKKGQSETQYYPTKDEKLFFDKINTKKRNPCWKYHLVTFNLKLIEEMSMATNKMTQNQQQTWCTLQTLQTFLHKGIMDCA